MDQDQQQELPTVQQETEAPVEEEVAPTKSVKNFWERLDEVFTQNTELRERMEELVEQFPQFQPTQNQYKSFIFQPERIALCSNDDITPSSQQPNANPAKVPSTVNGHYPSEKFSQFRIRLRRPLRNVKSIQLLSGVIPNAVQNIPDSQTFFFWYKIRSVATANQGAWTIGATYLPGDIVSYSGLDYVVNTEDTASAPAPPNSNPSYQTITLPADTTRPNYYDLNPSKLKYLWLAPSYWYPYETVAAGNQLLFNRTFQDYQDLVLSLNYIITQNLVQNNAQNDISFKYDDVLNKIIMIPNAASVAANTYYLPCGYADPNINAFMTNPAQIIYGTNTAFSAPAIQFTPESTLNLRLGFTWNGSFPNPFQSSDPWSDLTLQSAVYWYMRAKDPGFYAGPPPGIPYIPPWGQEKITFNSYPDLVNTSCVRIYADFALGSTQDSLDSSAPQTTASVDGLLSIVPVNTTNLGVGFYQNNFNNPLTKIPQVITEVGITMLNDQGLPYYLPNSATVLLELAIEYL